MCFFNFVTPQKMFLWTASTVLLIAKWDQVVCYYWDWKWLQKQPPGVFYEKGVYKNFAKSTGKHQCRSLIFILRPAALLKKRLRHRRDFPVKILRNFEKQLFHRTPPNDAFRFLWLIRNMIFQPRKQLIDNVNIGWNLKGQFYH